MNWKHSLLVATMGLASAAFAQKSGVSDSEISIGLLTDLSGPITNYGKELRNGGIMAAEEVNAKGGVNGRKLKLLVEDHGYEPRRAVLAAQKLVMQDGVFAVIGTLGTPTSMSTLPFLMENKVINFMPVAAAKELYDPPSPYKVGFAPSYVKIGQIGLDYMTKQKAYKKLCILYQDDDFGREALQGVEEFSKARNLPLAEKTSYKRGATDFSSQMAKMKAADCDLVFSATTMREYVASVTEARKIGYNPDFLATSASYSHLVHVLGGKAMEGVYANTMVPMPYADDTNPAMRAWFAAYKKRFGEDPGWYSMLSYYAVNTFAKVAEKAGKNLTTESFNTAAEATKLPPDALGNPPFNISASNRLSNERMRMVQVKDGKWVYLSDFLDPPKLK